MPDSILYVLNVDKRNWREGVLAYPLAKRFNNF